MSYNKYIRFNIVADFSILSKHENHYIGIK